MWQILQGSNIHQDIKVGLLYGDHNSSQAGIGMD